MGTTTLVRPGLAELIAGVRVAATRHAEDPRRAAHAVADVLRASPALGTDILTAAERTETRGHVLHAEADFSITAIVWSPGQITRIHDHIAWCAFGVLEGVEHETLYRDNGDHLTEIGQTANHVGDVSGFAPPGDIHRVHNTSTTNAISLHIYGADLSVAGSSVRRYYDIPVR
ncbi:cysteine dioxygenase [Solihabitans fulvus]|uniref:Cysteine dioxygenase n=1 Tax=Solihabitans fulvus TaxID=1892852 RepID=A0A5B2XR90_9PSEU|nr:cysteine dioxygenase family protein [Solihabitans fulvus]KAA2265401.1 cysteine dioxygenase [Solihabitans fulvus]